MQQLQILSSPVASQTLTTNLHFTSTGKHGFNDRNPKTLALTTHKSSKLSVKCRRSDYSDQQKSNAPPAAASRPAVGGSQAKYYVGHSIYKGKAALTVDPLAPEFVAVNAWAFKLTREGYALLQFAPAVGARQYDWNRKQVFSLSVGEIGTLISLGQRESCEFFHDPHVGKSDEGKVRKVLKVEPLPDGSGYFFNLSVKNKLINVDESINLPITRAEFAVLKSAFNYLLPYFMGLHAFTNTIKLNDTSVNDSNAKYGGDYEWSR